MNTLLPRLSSMLVAAPPARPADPPAQAALAKDYEVRTAPRPPR